MLSINYLAVAVAAAAAFVEGALWYSPLLFGRRWLSLRGVNADPPKGTRPPAWKVAAELARCLVVAWALAAFICLLGIASIGDSLLLALALWLGFQAMQTIGSVIHEGYPWQLYAIHVGDALVKTSLMSAIVAAWR